MPVAARADDRMARPALTLARLRFWALLAAILVYGAGGVLAPERIGPVEIAVGFLLVLALGGVRAAHVLMPGGRGLWQAAARLLLVYGLTVPVVTGLAHGYGPVPILRDIIPFLFLLLPLFLLPLLAESRAAAGWVFGAVAAAGVLFAVRVLLPFWQSGNLRLGVVNDPDRLANAPTVLYAALLLLGMAGAGLYRSAGAVSAARAALWALLALPPLLAMAFATQRASMGLVALFLLALAAYGFARRPARAMLPVLALAAAAVFGWEQIAGVGQALLHKNMLVGSNMRWQEAQAVLDRLGGGAYAALFGGGWGVTFPNPAVGGDVVGYTHNLFTTYLLKSGLCGLVLVALYLAGLATLLPRLVRRSPVAGLALAAPLLIDLTLYASFKSLDFGMILMLIVLGDLAVRPLHPGLSCSMQDLFPEPEPEETGRPDA